MDLSLFVESALVDGSYSVGMPIDWSKCFDRVPQEIAFKLAERQGLHPRVLQPLRGMYRELRRRLVMARHVPQNGIIEGCFLSVLLLFLFFMNMWARSVKAGTTTAMPKVFADDAGVLRKKSEDIDIASHIT